MCFISAIVSIPIKEVTSKKEALQGIKNYSSVYIHDFDLSVKCNITQYKNIRINEI